MKPKFQRLADLYNINSNSERYIQAEVNRIADIHLMEIHKQVKEELKLTREERWEKAYN